MSQTVQILMSTYNGAVFLKEQLDSLLVQTWPEVEILIRDDGSTDATLSILRKYEEKYPQIHVFAGENQGACTSFFSLLAKSDADFVAFCDQDDIWLPEKVSCAVAALDKIEGPALYCSNKVLVDRDGNVIRGNGHIRLRPAFANAAVECICTGCTAMMNRALCDSIKAHLPQHAILHDWWCYLAACHTGEVYYDTQAYILYRQHGANAVGASENRWKQLKAKAAYLKKNRGKLKQQLTEFQALYSPDGEHGQLLDLLLGSETFPGNIRASLSHAYFRQSSMDTLIVRILLFLKRML